jgi:hypothetical protein
MTNPYRAMCAELAEELVNEYGYCTEWEKGLPLCESNVSELLTRARRPKPPSLKEQALVVLDDCANCLDGAHENTIRRALEALDD